MFGQGVVHLFFKETPYFQAHEAVFVFLNQPLVGEAEIVAVEFFSEEEWDKMKFRKVKRIIALIIKVSVLYRKRNDLSGERVPSL